ncbi:putative beta-glucosidase I [Cyberlindnera fabianii]|uniref:beta-glucosidase n=1 Tax=Cyberlindnera fabianii TaxID=36022 RepID=A0A1V2KZC8_CYBFA|nr:putative beta-glucosidase I [Cyberlindnera fabianii]
MDVDNVLSQLTTPEKISLVSGGDYWHIKAIPRLNVPAIRTSDGPNGIRGLHHFNSTPTACVPVGTALGSTWNKKLLYDVGRLLDLEARAKGVHVLLAPTVNIQRIPNGGRGFESFSEDPVLSGELAAAYINGFQEDGLAATIKHYVCNDQENERFSSDSIVSERALREIYLKPFEIAIKKSNPKALMTSYNKVNGTHASENQHLYNILRKEWGWDGLVMSDWTGTYSTSEAINTGLDLEMPGTGRWRGAALNHALFSKTVTDEKLDERVRNVLNLVKSVENSGVPENAPEKQRNTPEDQAFLRIAAAESVVLLKNDNKVLPLDPQKKVLVVGPNANYAAYSGGGSALATPYYAVPPLDAIKQKCGDDNVKYEIGAFNHRYMPTLKSQLYIKGTNVNGTLIEIYNEPPTDRDRKPFDVVKLSNIHYFRMNDYVHPGLKDSNVFYADLTSTFIPDHDGEYEFGAAVFGTAKVFIDGNLVIDNCTKQEVGESFYGLGTPEVTGTYKVSKGKEYRLKIEFGSGATSPLNGKVNSTFYGGGGLRFGGVLKISDDEAISRALSHAKQYDQIVFITGLNQDWESEGADRKDLEIPGASGKLIEELVKVNEDVVVVVQAGTPVEMPWVDKLKTLVYTSYGGNETGNAIADVLFGDVNPSGKLPLTFPYRFEDTPSFINNTTNLGKVLYGEDVYVGYRYFEKTKREVMFSFGHGLSYTEFKFSDLKVTANGDDLNILLTVQNTGSKSGAAVVQLYIQAGPSKTQRPIKELKGFEKVFINAGEKTRITSNLKIKEATSYYDDEKNKWVSEEGVYTLIAGQSSVDEEALTHEFCTEKTILF